MRCFKQFSELCSLQSCLLRQNYVDCLLVYGGALICGCSFVAPFWIRLYDLIVDGPGYLSKAACWLKGPGYKEPEE